MAKVNCLVVLELEDRSFISSSFSNQLRGYRAKSVWFFGLPTTNHEKELFRVAQMIGSEVKRGLEYPTGIFSLTV